MKVNRHRIKRLIQATLLIPGLALAGATQARSTPAADRPPLALEVQTLIDACARESTRSPIASDGRTHIEAIRFHSNPLKPNVSCGINTRLSRAGDDDDISSRTIAVNSQGLFQVIVADETIPGPLSKVTGTHTFYLLPRQPDRIVPATSLDEKSGVFRITAMNGETFRVNSETARIEGYSGGNIHEDDTISLGPTGGVAFESIHSGLLLDCGWRTGNVATTRPNGACQVRDSKGKTCSVPNSLLFRYTRAGGAPSGPIDEVIPRFETSEAMSAILNKLPACAALDPDWSKPRVQEPKPVDPCETANASPPIPREAGNLSPILEAVLGAPSPTPPPTPPTPTP
jgi:hypothetical protein